MGTIIYSEGRRFVWNLKEREARKIGFNELLGHQDIQIPLFPLEKKKTLLSDVILELEQEYRKCMLCPKECGINREKEIGYCSVSLDSSCFERDILVSEERLISPTYAVFFQGCNLRCIYCHVQPEIFSRKYGITYHPEETTLGVNDISSIKTLSFTGGNPDNSIKPALETIFCLGKETPIVWNTNLYVQKKVLDFLDQIIEVYLIDLKTYKNCSEFICGEKDYFEVVTKNLRYIVETQPEAIVIVRHLPLPRHINCCTEPILCWMRDNIKGAKFHLMIGYHPWHRAMTMRELRRILRDDEIDKAIKMMRKYRIENMEQVMI